MDLVEELVCGLYEIRVSCLFLCMDSLSSVALSNFRGGLLKRHVRTYGLHLQDTIQLVTLVAVLRCRLPYLIAVAHKGM